MSSILDKVMTNAGINHDYNADNEANQKEREEAAKGTLERIGDEASNTASWLENSALGQAVGGALSWLGGAGTPVDMGYDFLTNGTLDQIATNDGTGGPTLKDAIDYTNTNMNYRDIPFVGQLVGHAADAATSTVGSMAYGAGARDFGEYLLQEAQKGENRLAPMSTPEASLAFLTDPNGMTAYTGQLLGSLATLMAPMPYFKAAAGVGRVANALGKGREALKAVPKVGGTLYEAAPAAALWSTQTPFEALAERGSAVRDALQEGASEEEATRRGNEVFRNNLLLLGATNALEGGALGKMVKAITGNGTANFGRRAAGVVGGALGSYGTQVYEEGAQQGLQSMAKGEVASLNPFNFNEEQRSESAGAAAGMLPLTMFGLGGGLAGARYRSRGGSFYSNDEATQNAINVLDNLEQPTQQEAPQAAPQAEASTTGNGLDGTNINSTYFSKWESSEGATDLTGIQGSVQAALNQIGQEYYAATGETLTITGGAEKGAHAGGENGHEGGWKVDVDNGGISNPDLFTQLCAKYGAAVGDEGDHFDLSFNSAGGVGGTQIATPNSYLSDNGGSSGGGNVEGWDIANAISQKLGGRIPASWILAQMRHEGANFTSDLAVEDHNYGGLKDDDGNYRHFDSDEEFADFMANTLAGYAEDGIFDAQNIEDYAHALKHGGYYTADESEYSTALRNHLNEIGGDSARGGNSSNVKMPDMDTNIDTSAEEASTESMYRDFANYWREVADTPEERNMLEGMFSTKDRFVDSEENRKALDEAPEEIKQAYQQYKQEQAARQQGAQQAPQVAPTIEKAETPKLEQAREQQKVNTDASTNIRQGLLGGAPSPQRAPQGAQQNSPAIDPVVQAAEEVGRANRAALERERQNAQKNSVNAQNMPQTQNNPANAPQGQQETQIAPQNNPQAAQNVDNTVNNPAQPVQQQQPAQAPQQAQAMPQVQATNAPQAPQRAQNVARGQELAQQIQASNITMPSGLSTPLQEGQPKAIAAAEQLIAQNSDAKAPDTEKESGNNGILEQDESNQAAREEHQGAGHIDENAEPRQGKNEEGKHERKDKDAEEVELKHGRKGKHKYYLNERPIDKGSTPKDFVGFDEEDKGGKYGAVYFDRELSEDERKQYQLTDKARSEEAPKESSKEAMNAAKSIVKRARNGEISLDEAKEELDKLDLADKDKDNAIHAAEMVKGKKKGDNTKRGNKAKLQQSKEPPKAPKGNAGGGVKYHPEPQTEEDRQYTELYPLTVDKDELKLERLYLHAKMSDATNRQIFDAIGQKTLKKSPRNGEVTVEMHKGDLDNIYVRVTCREEGKLFSGIYSVPINEIRAYASGFGDTSSRSIQSIIESRFKQMLVEQGMDQKNAGYWATGAVGSEVIEAQRELVGELYRQYSEFVPSEVQKERISRSEPKGIAALKAAHDKDFEFGIENDNKYYLTKPFDEATLPQSVVGYNSHDKGGEYGAVYVAYPIFSLNDYDMAKEGKKNSAESGAKQEEAKEREEVEIEKGKKAIAKILASHQDVKAAMYREETGDIEFIYGKEGDAAHKYKGGYGIAKILAKHGQKAVNMIPEVIAKGRAEKRYDDRVHFVLGDYTAVVRLDFDGKERVWLVTNFEAYKKEPSKSEDFAHSDSPSDNVDSVAAESSSSSIIPQNEQKGEGKPTTEKNSARGKEVSLISDNGKEVKATYKVVEATDLVTSNLPMRKDNFAVNPEYPKELQPRDRNRQALREQVEDMANNLRPEDVAAARNVNNGAPVVNGDNVVLNGNGRSLAIIRAVAGRREAGKKYRQYLLDNAEDFGLKREDIEGMKNPVLVRELADTSEETTQEVINSTAGGARMGASEQAQSDAKKITLELLNDFEEGSSGLKSPANRQFVMNVLQKITSKNDINAYLTANGEVNEDGLTRVRRALCALAYEDGDLIAHMSEDVDDNIANIGRALNTAAPAVAKLKKMMDAGEANSYPLSTEIAQAVKKIMQLREQGTPVEVWFDEIENGVSLFGGENAFDNTSEAAKAIIGFIDRNKRSGKKITSFMERLADIIKGQGDPRNGSLFGEMEKPSLLSIIDRAANEAENGGQVNMFDEAAKLQEETAKTEQLANETAGIKEEATEATEAENKPFTDANTAAKAFENIFGIKKQEEKQPAPKKKSTRSKTSSKKATEAKKPKKRIKLVDDSKENEEALLKQLQEALKASTHRLNANPIFDPAIISPAVKLGILHLQRGINRFADFAETMLDSLGDVIRPWLKPMWNAAVSYDGKELNEDKLTYTWQLVGAKFQDGIDNYRDMRQFFADEYGEDVAKSIDPYIKAAFNGVEAYFNNAVEPFVLEEAEENGTDGSTGGMAERAGEGTNSDAVGKSDEGATPRAGERQGVRETGEGARARDSVRVLSGRAADSGKTGNSELQVKEPGNRGSSTGNEHLSGSATECYGGLLANDDKRSGQDIVTPKDGREHEGDSQAVKAAKENKKATTAGTLEHQIERDLPMLLPEQREDVVFMERRLEGDNDGYEAHQGVMLTNGTGTGKTFSGLGAVKRMALKGKKNILIVSPSAQVNKQWADTAKKFFGLDVYELKDTKDAGTGITITTYANFAANDSLVNRNWDMIVTDESQTLMENEKGDITKALDKLRALSYHHAGLDSRFNMLHRAEYEELHRLGQTKGQEAQAQARELQTRLNKEFEKVKVAWREKENKPKVVLLSATPFARVKDVEYAEGYLFDFGTKKATGYNDTNAREDFFVKNFGYRMRYDTLTKPDDSVDNSVMEMDFYERLKREGAVRGRAIQIDVDYDRGFLLTPNKLGAKLDAGLQALEREDKYDKLRENLALNRKAKTLLLEAIKAREAIPIIKEYLKSGKKVVVFHQSMKQDEFSSPFELDTSLYIEDKETVLRQYEQFQREFPELFDAKLWHDLKSPIVAMREAFGDRAGFFNGGREATKSYRDKNGKLVKREDGTKVQVRAHNVDEFQNDDSGKDILVVQQDAGKAGISLHDTTGKHQRVLLVLSFPSRPTYAIQEEGRIYRVGSKTNAIIRYVTTGTNMEKAIFADTIAGRAGTAENLSMGRQARGLRESFANLYMETMDGSWERRKPGAEGEGTGGKEADRPGDSNVSDYDRAKTYYYGQQKKTGRNKATEGKDYFATPEPIGLKMVEWAQLKAGERVLEPSAGHGAISRWFAPTTDQTIVEPSGHLAPMAKLVTPNAKVINGRFEDLNEGANKYDAIVMNPPFGTAGRTAVDHIAKAFRHLNDGGRIVAILPEGSALNKLDKWLDSDEALDAYVRGIVRLPSATFGRAGTNVRTRIVIIDKANTAPSESAKQVDYTAETEDINELFDQLENMEMPERLKSDENKRTYAQIIDDLKAHKIDLDTADVQADTLARTSKRAASDYDSYIKKKRRVTETLKEDIEALHSEHGTLEKAAQVLFDEPISALEKGGISAERAQELIREARSQAYNMARLFNDGTLTFSKVGAMEEGAARRLEKAIADAASRESENFNRVEHAGKPSVTIKGRIPREQWREVSDLARKYGGNYKKKRFSGDNWFGFEFAKEEGREAFIKAADKLLSPQEEDTKTNTGAAEEATSSPFVKRNIKRSDGKTMYLVDPVGTNQLEGIWQKILTAANKYGSIVSSRAPLGSPLQFKTEAGREAFLKEANGLVGKYSITGLSEKQADELRKQAKSVKDEQLTKQERTYSDFAKSFGATIHWIEADSRLNGYAKDGVIYINRNAKMSKAQIFWHELFHLLKANNEDLYNDVMDVLGITDAQRAQYLDETGRSDVSGMAVNEEMLADAMIDVARRNGLMSDLISKAPDVFTRLKMWAQEYLARFISALHKPAGGLTTKQRDELVKAFKGFSKQAGTTAETKYSLAPGIKVATDKLKEKAGLKQSDLVEIVENRDENELGFVSSMMKTPSRLAQTKTQIKPYIVMANRAMQLLTSLRSSFDRHLTKAWKGLSKKEHETLNNILLNGDAMAHEYTEKELEEMDVGDKVINSYKELRRQLNRAYRLINEAYRRPVIKSARLSDAGLEELRTNDFVEVMRVQDYAPGVKLVTYKEYQNEEKEAILWGNGKLPVADGVKVQVLSTEELPDGTTRVRYRAGKAVNKWIGYVPHIFHEFLVSYKNADGETVILGSGKTIKEAVELGEKLIKEGKIPPNAASKVRVAPKVFNFDKIMSPEAAEEFRQSGVTVGDQDYEKMTRAIAEKFDMSLADAREALEGIAHKKARHRFNGNVLTGKGVQGYEQDMQWAIRRYLFSAARYYALETEFKPRAISMYERQFGDFDGQQEGVAKYVRDYINDINGNPTALEKSLSTSIKNSFLGKFLTHTFGDRVVLSLASEINKWTTYSCLGCLNVSSAMLNFTQLINAAGLLGDAAAPVKCMARGLHKKYTYKDAKVLLETGVLDDIGLDSGAGYDKARGFSGDARSKAKAAYQLLDKVGQAGMLPFKASEALVRRGVVLAAYDKAIKEGKSHDEAIKYAKEINRRCNFDYSVVDAPNIFRRGSIISQLALQFKKYGFNQLALMADMCGFGTYKTTPKQRAIFWGSYFILVGLCGFPALDWLDKLLGNRLKTSAQECIIAAAGDSYVGKKLAQTAMYGLPGSLFGVSLSNRAGLPDVIPTQAKDVMPPLINKVQGFITDMSSGNTASAIRDVSPGLYNQYAAWYTGVSTDKRGRINNSYDDFYSKCLRAIGFKSTQETIDADVKAIMSAKHSDLSAEKQAAVDDFIRDSSTENAKRLKDLGITKKQVDAERKKKQQTKHERTKKGAKGDDDILMRFAE